MNGLRRQEGNARLGTSRSLRGKPLARNEDTAMDAAMRSSYEVTSEGRVEVNVSKLVESDAVQRIAKLAERIAKLSAQVSG